MTPITSPSPAAPATRHDPHPVVAAQGLTKVFKDFWLRPRAHAVDAIDFEIHQGEIFGLLGPNGSGKSTTIKLLLGLLKKSRGRLLVLGKPPNDVAVKKRIGYLPEESYLYPFLNARETLDYYARLFSLERRLRLRRIDELLDMVGLTAVQTRQVREYSKGMQRRIGIAQALINDPEFLILDEPTTGLDPLGARQVKDLILHLGRRGKTILLSSHLLSDVEDCVDRMVILYGGRIRAQGTCDQLLQVQQRSVIETDSLDDQTIAELDALLHRHNRRIESLSHPRQRLEDLFVGLVERARSEHLATSGALSGGQTAPFLMGDQPDSDQGESLIDRLVSSASVQPPIPLPTHQPTPSHQPTGRDDTLIGALVSSDAAPPAPAPDAPSSAHDSPPTVDEDLIQGLLNPSLKNPSRPDKPGATR